MVPNPSASALWLQHDLFAGLDRAELPGLGLPVHSARIRPGEYVCREGDAADALYVVLSGELAVTRRDVDGHEHELRRLGHGDVFGELGMIGRRVRTASVRAVDDVVVQRLDYSALPSSRRGSAGATHSGARPWTSQVRRNVGEFVTQRVGEISDDVVALARERLKMGQFFVSVVLFLVLYACGLSAMTHIEADALMAGFGPILSAALIIMFAFGCVFNIRMLGWRIERFGVTLKGAGRSLLEGAALSAVCIGLYTLGRLLLIHTHPDFAGAPLIGLQTRLAAEGPARMAMFMGLYVLLAPVQEFIVRGVLQTTLENFLCFKHRSAWAILVSNVLFSSAHLHISPTLAGLAFVSGLLWGWLYARHHNLLGVCLVHAALGLHVLYVMPQAPV